MRFKEGDKVEFIDQGELKQGVVNEIRATNHDISYQIVYFGGEKKIWFAERELLSPAPVLKVPQCVADWIEQKKANGDQLYIAMDKSWESMNYTVSDWLEEGEDRYNKFARAWLDGYEVEKEPLYYVHFIEGIGGYLNMRYDGHQRSNGKDQNYEYKTQFTEAEIKAMDKGEAYWLLREPVEEVEGEA
ncbi:DUF1642 domain-containing protein [Listeria monocytogenes]|nr:DUF1642 domain-containing protein [Listeria monocytogenes]EAD7915807.1 DUF1642 domain-containing protein [Listeria monocytogenes]